MWKSKAFMTRFDVFTLIFVAPGITVDMYWNRQNLYFVYKYRCYMSLLTEHEKTKP